MNLSAHRSSLLAILALILVAIVGGVDPARAQTLLPIYYLGGNNLAPITSTTASEVVGNAYTTTATITFTALGFIDVDANYITSDGLGDGLNGSYQIGLWNASGTLLASTTVTPSSALFSPSNFPPGANDGYRFSSISPVTLPSGTSFTIGVLLPSGTLPDPFLLNAVSANVDSPSITGGGFGLSVNSNTLSLPTNHAPSDTIYDAANGLYYVGAPAPTPEPATLAYLVLGLGCLALFQHHRMKQTL